MDMALHLQSIGLFLFTSISNHPSIGKHPISSDKDADIKQLEAQLSELLGTTVSIDDKRGRGKLLIDYHNLDQLDGIIKKLKSK